MGCAANSMGEERERLMLPAAMNRYRQAGIWILWAFVLGAIQALASFLPVMIERGNLGSLDLHRVLYGVALVYGGAWFIPALLVSDLFLVKRTLSWRDLTRIGILTAILALVIGLVLGGMMAMIGYPATAISILVLGFVHRKRERGKSGI